MQSQGGGSGSFLIRANDGERYWCKTLNNLQNEPRVPANEQLVARLGLLIGAPCARPSWSTSLPPSSAGRFAEVPVGYSRKGGRTGRERSTSRWRLVTSP
jgi:hypothetical protein